MCFLCVTHSLTIALTHTQIYTRTLSDVYTTHVREHMFCSVIPLRTSFSISLSLCVFVCVCGVFVGACVFVQSCFPSLSHSHSLTHFRKMSKRKGKFAANTAAVEASKERAASAQSSFMSSGRGVCVCV